jgi:hypothetical protein
MRSLWAVVLAIAMTACVSAPAPNRKPPSPSQMGTPSPPGTQHPSWLPRSHEGFGVRVQLPSTWVMTWNPLRDGTLGDIFLMGSWSFMGSLPECRQIPPGQALIALSESLATGATADPKGYGPRPSRFETAHLRSSQVRKGCDQPKAQLFRFEDSGRLLYAWMMFGRKPPRGIRTKAEAVLSTLMVSHPG